MSCVRRCLPSFPKRAREPILTPALTRSSLKTLVIHPRVFADANLNTAVVQASAVSERPIALDGKVIAFTTDALSVEHSAICSADGFERCEETPEGNVRVHFGTHEQASCAVKMIGLPFGIALEYNGRPYKDRGWVRSGTLWRKHLHQAAPRPCTMPRASSAHLSHWLVCDTTYRSQCVGEESWAKLASGQLHACLRQQPSQSGISELVRFDRYRAKLTNISGGTPQAVTLDEPLDLDAVQARLEKAHFTGKGDKSHVMWLTHEFDWQIMAELRTVMATERLRSQHASAVLLPPPPPPPPPERGPRSSVPWLVRGTSAHGAHYTQCGQQGRGTLPPEFMGIQVTERL